MRFRLAVALGVGLVACGGGSHQLKPKNPFPTRDALEQLAAAPPKPVKSTPVVSVDAWAIEAASLDGTASGGETTIAMSVAKSSQLTLVKELRCVARESARFWLEHKAEPTARLKRFLYAACGATSSVDVFRFTSEAPEKVSDAELANEIAKKLELPKEVHGKAAGVALVRKGDAFAVMVAFGRPDASLAIELPDASGRARITGTLAPHVNADLVVALMNRGPYAVVRCDTNFSVPLPRFDFSCPMAPEDQLAPLEIVVHEPGRLITKAVAHALVKRSIDTPLALPQSKRAKRPVTTPNDLAKATLDFVNEARAAAGLGPLAVAPRQTPVNQRLAEHFFAADANGDAATEDLVALGLIAGWDVDGMIRRGDFFAALAGGTSDASSFVDYALDMPSGRSTLLAPEAQQIAIGAPPFDHVGGLGVVATTYSFFGSYDHRADAQRIFDRLVAARMARRLPLPQRIQQLPELAAQAKLAASGHRDLMDALQHGAMLESQRTGRWMHGWAFVGFDLDSIVFPDELFAPNAIGVGIEVTHFKPEGAAWGAYLVYLVTPGGANIQSAKLETGRGKAASLRIVPDPDPASRHATFTAFSSWKPM